MHYISWQRQDSWLCGWWKELLVALKGRWPMFGTTMCDIGKVREVLVAYIFCNKLRRGLKQLKCILSHFWRPKPEISLMGPKSRCQQNCFSSRGYKTCLLASFCFWWLLAFFSLWLYCSVSVLIAASFSLCLLPLPFSYKDACH